jgi:hypothetical protein
LKRFNTVVMIPAWTEWTLWTEWTQYLRWSFRCPRRPQSPCRPPLRKASSTLAAESRFNKGIVMNKRVSLSRRGFLTMAAGATLLPFTAASASRVLGANGTLRIGVIGCGARGTELIRDLLSRRNNGVPIRIAAVCDICGPHRACRVPCLRRCCAVLAGPRRAEGSGRDHCRRA